VHAPTARVTHRRGCCQKDPESEVIYSASILGRGMPLLGDVRHRLMKTWHGSSIYAVLPSTHCPVTALSTLSTAQSHNCVSKSSVNSDILTRLQLASSRHHRNSRPAPEREAAYASSNSATARESSSCRNACLIRSMFVLYNFLAKPSTIGEGSVPTVVRRE
jgi:hypothetical protein